MKDIYNEQKTEIMQNPDLSLGHLQDDTIIIHIDGQEEIKEVFHYETIREYPNGGRDVKKIIDVEHKPFIEEHDEIKEIYVYVPYTQEELEEIDKQNLRRQRIELLNAFDIWEKAVLRNREEDSEIIMEWYQGLLDLKKDCFLVENIPDRIKHYLYN